METTEEESIASATSDEAELFVSLNDQRLEAVAEQLRNSAATRVIDLGCGEGKLLRKLIDQRQFTEIVGMDVSIRALEIANKRLKMERMTDRQRDRIRLMHGSLMYRDQRLSGFDAASIVEVIEHLDPPRLAAFERVVFEFARPQTVVVTTPNREYNLIWKSLPAGAMRHSDHRFEWTREEFQTWGRGIADQFGYTVEFHSIGPYDEQLGAPTQMGVFSMPANG